MKNCNYCGRANVDQTDVCAGCGTKLSGDSADWRDLRLWVPRSDVGLAIAGGIASVLICTGMYFMGAKAAADFLKLFKLFHFNPIEAGRGRIITSIAFYAPQWFRICSTAVTTLVAVLILRFRCRRSSHAIVAGVAAVPLIAFSILIPGIWTLALPSMLLGVLTASSLGFYFGSVLQLLVGAWLLGAFSQTGTRE